MNSEYLFYKNANGIMSILKTKKHLVENFPRVLSAIVITTVLGFKEEANLTYQFPFTMIIGIVVKTGKREIGE